MSIFVRSLRHALKALREFAEQSRASEGYIGFGNSLLEDEPDKSAEDSAIGRAGCCRARYSIRTITAERTKASCIGAGEREGTPVARRAKAPAFWTLIGKNSLPVKTARKALRKSLGSSVSSCAARLAVIKDPTRDIPGHLSLS